MIDIYDEVGYIKNVLRDGIGEKWERDAILLTRYYKMEGVKKSVAKNKIREKCEIAAIRNVNPISYNHLVSYQRFNNIFEHAWSNKEPLRAIHGVEISREVLNWFLGLEDSLVFTEEEYEYYKKRRPNCKVSKKTKKPLTWNRIKYLFGLYIWVKVKEQYVERPNVLYLAKFKNRFKEDAGLSSAFNLQKERDFLSDLGYINVNFALGIEVSFIEKFDVFKIPITDENRVWIETGEPGKGDLYLCGNWLEKQRYGYYTCECCGKQVKYEKDSMGRAIKTRKYCKECEGIIRHGKAKEETKTIECIDCHTLFEVSVNNTKTCRCKECQHKKDNELTLKRVQKYKENSQFTPASGEYPIQQTL